MLLVELKPQVIILYNVNHSLTCVSLVEHLGGNAAVVQAEQVTRVISMDIIHINNISMDIL